MPLSPIKFLPYEAKTILIKVFSYTNKNIKGSLSNITLANDEKFDNLAQMLFGIEKILDDNQFPQPNLETRTFTQISDISDSAKGLGTGKNVTTTEDEDQGISIATFKLSVLFRQNASWQGNLVWLENNSAAQFRSVFELIQLLDSVL